MVILFNILVVTLLSTDTGKLYTCILLTLVFSHELYLCRLALLHG